MNFIYFNQKKKLSPIISDKNHIMDKTSAITLLDSYATKSCRSWKVSKSDKNYIVFCCDNPD